MIVGSLRGGLWGRFWFAEASLERLALFRILLLALAFNTVLRFAPGILGRADGQGAAFVERTWRPILLLDLLGVGPPGTLVARSLLVLTLVAIGLGMVGLRTRASCWAAALLVTFWIAVAYSLGKPHHDTVALTLGLWSLGLGPVEQGFTLDAWLRRRRGAGSPGALALGAGLPLRFTQLTVVIGYSAAGISKLVCSGGDWWNGYSLQSHMLAFHAPWTEALAGNIPFVRLSSIVTVLLQATFFLALVPRLRWVYLPFGVAFHIVSWKTMNTGSYHSLWGTYIAFLPLEAIWPWVLRGGWRWVRGAVLFGGLLGVAWVSSTCMPAGAGLVLAGLLVASFGVLLCGSDANGRALSSPETPPSHERHDPQVRVSEHPGPGVLQLGGAPSPAAGDSGQPCSRPQE